MKNTTAKLLMACSILFSACVLDAQELKIAERPIDADEVVPVYSGVAPGSEQWNWKEELSIPPWGGRGGRLVRNVVQPTLTIFNPPNEKISTHTAVIIAPGGGFRWLSIDSEGYDVARALAARGVTALVLKYRLDHTPDDEDAFRKDAIAFLTGVAQGMKSTAAAPPKLPSPSSFADAKPGRKDGAAAIDYVRRNAARLHIDPQRIGIIGFSAGGSVTNFALTEYDSQTRPDFAAEVYSGGSDVPWKPDTPPVFLAVAGDDQIAAEWCLKMFQSLRESKKSVELHVYASGGHGFGMEERGLTTDLWLNEFAAWLSSLGYLTPQ